MRWRLGPIPEEAGNLASDPLWCPLREPSAFVAQLIALPIVLLTGVTLVLTMAVAAPGLLRGMSIELFAICFVAMIPLHEGIHVLCHPGWGGRRDSVVGLWPRYLLFYGQWLGEWPRNRAILCLLAPFAALTVFPLVVAVALQLNSPALGALILANAVGAALDLFGALLSLQVPSSSILKNNGYKTYWRPAGLTSLQATTNT